MTAHASEPDLFGMGARGSAMGGTGVADAEGYDATWLNPAGLAAATRRRLSLGYVVARYRLSLDGKPHPVDGTDGVLFGAAVPLPFGGWLTERMALGVAFYTPTGVLNRARSPYPDEPRLALIEQRSQVASAMVALGLRVHRRLSIGAGALALGALVGSVAIAPDGSGRITTTAEEQIEIRFAPILGLRVEVARFARVGLTYRGESQASYDVTIKTKLGDRLPLELPVLRIAGVAQFDPMQLALEAAFTLPRGFTVAAGLTWKHWAAYPLPSENATPGAPPLARPDFHDTVVPRLGGELTHAWRPLTLHARAGYFYEWSPAPAGAPILIDAGRHVLTAGVGIDLRVRWFSAAIDLFGQWHHLQSTAAAGDLGVFGFTVGVDL